MKKLNGVYTGKTDRLTPKQLYTNTLSGVAPTRNTLWHISRNITIMKPKLMMRPRYSRPRFKPAPRHPFVMYYLLAALFVLSLVAQLLIKIFQ